MTNEIALNVPALTMSAKQLNVVIDVDPAVLEAELAPYLEGLASLELGSKSIVVNDADSNQRCVTMMNDAAAKEKGFDKIWKRFKAPLNAARTSVLEMEKQTSERAGNIKKVLSGKSGVYILQQKRLKEQAERQFANAANQQRRVLEDEAEDLLLQGHVGKAAEKHAEAAMTVAPTLPDDVVPYASGATHTDQYVASCTDTIALLKAIVEGKIPLMQEVKPGDVRPLVAVDQVVLNAIVKRLGVGLRWPGVSVEPYVKVAARRQA